MVQSINSMASSSAEAESDALPNQSDELRLFPLALKADWEGFLTLLPQVKNVDEITKIGEPAYRVDLLTYLCGFAPAEVIRPFIKKSAHPRAKIEDPSRKDTALLSPLVALVYNKQFATPAAQCCVATALIKFGCEVDPFESGTASKTPLIAAVIDGNIGLARLFLDYGAAIDNKNSDSHTAYFALSLAAMGSNNVRNSIYRMLLERGTDIDARDNQGFTSYQYAVFHQTEQKRNLINVQKYPGSPIFTGEVREKYGESAFELLVRETVVDINSISSKQKKSREEENIKYDIVVSYLIDYARKFSDGTLSREEFQKSYWNVLFALLKKGDLKIKPLLFYLTIQPQPLRSFGPGAYFSETDLFNLLDYLASIENCSMDYKDFMVRLLEHMKQANEFYGRSINLKAPYQELFPPGPFPMLEEEKQRILLNAQIKIPDLFKELVASLRRRGTSVEGLKPAESLPKSERNKAPRASVKPKKSRGFFINGPIEYDELVNADWDDVIEALIDAGDANHVVTGIYGVDSPVSLLTVAASLAPLEVISKLIKLGAEINPPVNDQITEYSTPLLAACSRGYGRDSDFNIDERELSEIFEVVKLLIEKGARVDAFDLYVSKSTYFPSAYQNYQVMQLLFEHGANPNQVNLKGENGYLVVSQLFIDWKQKAKILRQFINHGCETSKLSNDGCNALHLALHQGEAKAIKFHLKYGGISLDSRSSGTFAEKYGSSGGELLLNIPAELESYSEILEALFSEQPRYGNTRMWPQLFQAASGKPLFAAEDQFAAIALQHTMQADDFYFALQPASSGSIALGKLLLAVMDTISSQHTRSSVERAYNFLEITARSSLELAERDEIVRNAWLASPSLMTVLSQMPGLSRLNPFRVGQEDKIRSVRELIRNGIDITKPDPHSSINLIHQAIKDNHDNLVKEILELSSLRLNLGEDLSSSPYVGLTLIQVACKEKAYAALKVLADYYAASDYQSPYIEFVEGIQNGYFVFDIEALHTLLYSDAKFTSNVLFAMIAQAHPESVDDREVIAEIAAQAMSASFVQLAGSYDLDILKYPKNFIQFWGDVDANQTGFGSYVHMVDELIRRNPSVMSAITERLKQFNVDFPVSHRELADIDKLRSYDYALYEQFYKDRDEIINILSSHVMNFTDSASVMVQLLAETVAHQGFEDFAPLDLWMPYLTALIPSFEISLGDDDEDSDSEAVVSVNQAFLSQLNCDDVYGRKSLVFVTAMRFIQTNWLEIIERRHHYERHIDPKPVHNLSHLLVQLEDVAGFVTYTKGPEGFGEHYGGYFLSSLRTNTKILKPDLYEHNQSKIDKLIQEFKSQQNGCRFFLLFDLFDVIRNKNSKLAFYLNIDHPSNRQLDDKQRLDIHRSCVVFLEQLCELYGVNFSSGTSNYGRYFISPQIEWKRFFPEYCYDWNWQREQFVSDSSLAADFEFLATFRLRDYQEPI